MKVQEFMTTKNKGYLLLDKDYFVISEVKDFMKYLHATKSSNTLKTYCHDLKIFYEFCEIKGYRAIEICNYGKKGPFSILSEFVTWLQYPEYIETGVIDKDKEPARTSRTVNAIMAGVLSFYQYLSINNMIKEIPLLNSERSTNTRYKGFLSEMSNNITKVRNNLLTVSAANKEIEPITRDTFNKLFAACETRRDKLLVALMFESGLRVNEALGIHLSPELDDLQDYAIKIVARENNENGARVKRYAEGTVYIPNYVQKLINDYLINDVAKYDSEFLFLTQNGSTAGHPMKYQNAYDLFRRLSNKIGEKVHPHMLRHGFAQEKLDFGWTLEQIQTYLRHKNPTSTALYAKIKDEKKKELIDNFYKQREGKLKTNE